MSSYMEAVAGDILMSSLGQRGDLVLLTDTTEIKDAAPDADKIVTITAFKVGTYDIAAQPLQPMNITVTHATVNTTDTLGTITITGTSNLGDVITEVITPIADSIVAGTKCFKTVTSVTGAGWVIGGATADNITVGVGTLLASPVCFRIIYALTDTVFDTLVSSNTTVNGFNTAAAASDYPTLSAYSPLYGRFTDIKLTSGTVLLIP